MIITTYFGNMCCSYLDIQLTTNKKQSIAIHYFHYISYKIFSKTHPKHLKHLISFQLFIPYFQLKNLNSKSEVLVYLVLH